MGSAYTSEEALAAATVGPRKPLNGPVVLKPYDPSWPERFEAFARQVRAALGPAVVLLEHVGSTSVPELSAKPIIDMVLAVPDSTDESAYVVPLEAKGFRLRIREPDWHEHRLLRTPAEDGNLHVFSAGCSEIARMVAFRDHLRGDAADRRRYEATKRTLAARTWKYTQHYADAKSEVISDIMSRALSKERGDSG